MQFVASLPFRIVASHALDLRLKASPAGLGRLGVAVCDNLAAFRDELPNCGRSAEIGHSGILPGLTSKIDPPRPHCSTQPGPVWNMTRPLSLYCCWPDGHRSRGCVISGGRRSRGIAPGIRESRRDDDLQSIFALLHLGTINRRRRRTAASPFPNKPLIVSRDSATKNDAR